MYCKQCGYKLEHKYSDSSGIVFECPECGQEEHVTYDDLGCDW